MSIRRNKDTSHDYRIYNRIKVWEYLSTHHCVDCGESNPIVLEFDHVKGKKREKVSRLANTHGWDIVKKEIDKCEVRCSNCHKKKTAKTQNYYNAVKRILLKFKDKI